MTLVECAQLLNRGLKATGHVQRPDLTADEWLELEPKLSAYVDSMVEVFAATGEIAESSSQALWLFRQRLLLGSQVLQILATPNSPWHRSRLDWQPHVLWLLCEPWYGTGVRAWADAERDRQMAYQAGMRSVSG